MRSLFILAILTAMVVAFPKLSEKKATSTTKPPNGTVSEICHIPTATIQVQKSTVDTISFKECSNKRVYRGGPLCCEDVAIHDAGKGRDLLALFRLELNGTDDYTLVAPSCEVIKVDDNKKAKSSGKKAPSKGDGGQRKNTRDISLSARDSGPDNDKGLTPSQCALDYYPLCCDNTDEVSFSTVLMRHV
jgi:hypothetical protein